MIKIAQIRKPEEIRIVRDLFLEYQAKPGIDLDFQGFATEVETLPGEYEPFYGRLLLARHNGEVAGCVALRPLAAIPTAKAEATAEMKRLYVRSAHRAAGVGRLLVTHVIAEARATGYQQIVLETLPTMTGAQQLYESSGFTDILAYRHNPITGTRFPGLKL